MTAYSWLDMVEAKLEETAKRVETERIVLDTLNLSRPLDKDFDQIFSNVTNDYRDDKLAYRQLWKLRRDFHELQREVYEAEL